MVKYDIYMYHHNIIGCHQNRIDTCTIIHTQLNMGRDSIKLMMCNSNTKHLCWKEMFGVVDIFL